MPTLPPYSLSSTDQKGVDMIQVAIVILLILAIAYFIKEFRHQKRLASKQQALKDVEMDSDLLDIDKEIAEERAYQRDTQQDIDNLEKGKNHE